MILNKRTFLKYSITSLFISGYLWITKALAEWPTTVFSSKSYDGLIKELTNNTSAQTSDKINIKAPEIAENGAVVPISVDADLPNISTISILVVNNPSPLISIFELTEELLPFVSTRAKMAETSDIVALVKNTDGTFFMASRNIKVTIGGCGG